MTFLGFQTRILDQSTIDQLTNGLLNGLSFGTICERIVSARTGGQITSDEVKQVRVDIIAALRQVPRVFRELSGFECARDAAKAGV